MDKQKQLNEMHQILLSAGYDWWKTAPNGKTKSEYETECFYNAGYRKIPENAVVIPKEISCYDNVEKAVKTFNLDGKKVDFTEEQIMALSQIIHFKEKQENEVRKETAEKFAERLKAKAHYTVCNTRCVAVHTIDEICKELTESK